MFSTPFRRDMRQLSAYAFAVLLASEGAALDFSEILDDPYNAWTSSDPSAWVASNNPGQSEDSFLTTSADLATLESDIVQDGILEFQYKIVDPTAEAYIYVNYLWGQGEFKSDGDWQTARIETFGEREFTRIEVHNPESGTVHLDQIRFMPHPPQVEVDAGGKVDWSPRQDEYWNGDAIHYEAIPDDGYTFGGWEGSLSSPSTTLFVNHHASREYHAVFEKKIQIEELVTTISGNNYFEFDEPTGSLSFPPFFQGKMNINLSGPGILSWKSEFEGSNSSESNEQVLEFGQNAETISLDVSNRELNLSEFSFESSVRPQIFANSGGAVERQPEGFAVDYATRISLHATPLSEDFQFAGWTGEINSSDPETEAFAENERPIVANFFPTDEGFDIPLSIEGSGYYSQNDSLITPNGNAAWSLSDMRIGQSTTLRANITGPGVVSFSFFPRFDATHYGEFSVKLGDKTIIAPSDGHGYRQWYHYQSLVNDGSEELVIRFEKLLPSDLTDAISLGDLRFQPGYQLNVAVDEGSYTLTPESDTYAPGEIVTIQLSPDSSGTDPIWIGDAHSETLTASIEMTQHSTVQAAFVTPFEFQGLSFKRAGSPKWQAVDTPNEAFTSSVNYHSPWGAGDDSELNRYSVLSTRIEGPALLSFKAKSTEGSNQSYSILLDGNPINPSPLTADYEWEENAVEIPSGSHSLSWRVTNKLPNEMSVRDLSLSDFQLQPGFRVRVETSRGTVSATPQDSIVPSGTEVSLTPVPESGYDFYRWSGDFVSFERSPTLRVDSHLDIDAEFYKTVNGGGQSYKFGGAATWEYKSNHRSEFRDAFIAESIPQHQETWIDIPVSGEGLLYFDAYGFLDESLTLFLDDQKVTAETIPILPGYGRRFLIAIPSGSQTFRISTRGFAIDPGFNYLAIADINFNEGVPLSIVARGGSVSGVSLPNALPRGTSLTISANPDAGNRFLGWSGDSTSEERTLSLVLNEPQFIQASFGLDSFDGSESVSSSHPHLWYWQSEEVSKSTRGILSDAPEGISETWMEATFEGPGFLRFDASYTVGFTDNQYLVTNNGEPMSVFPTFHDPNEDSDRSLKAEIYLGPGEQKLRFTLRNDSLGKAPKLLLENISFTPGYRLALEGRNGESPFGTVSVNPESEVYSLGEEVSVKATPDSGYDFLYWEITTSFDRIEEPDIRLTPSDLGNTGYYPRFGLKINDVSFTSRSLARKFKAVASTHPESEDSRAISLSGDSHESTLAEALFNEQGVLSFSYKPSSTEESLWISLDGTPLHRLQNLSNWQEIKIPFSAGFHRVTFQLSSAGSEPYEARIDNIRFEKGIPLSVSNVSGGTVKISSGKYVFEPGETVVATATPDPGYVFRGWRGIGTDNPLELAITQQTELFPLFSKPYSFDGYTWHATGPDDWSVGANFNSPDVVSGERAYAYVEVVGPGLLLTDFNSDSGFSENDVYFSVTDNGEPISNPFELNWNPYKVGPGLHRIGFDFKSHHPNYPLSFSTESFTFEPKLDLRVETAPNTQAFTDPPPGKIEIGTEVSVSAYGGPEHEFIGWTGDFQGQPQSFTFTANDHVFGRPIFRKSISVSNLTLHQYPSSHWYNSSESITYQLKDESENGYMQTWINGPGRLSFRWNNQSSSANFAFYINGEELIFDDTFVDTFSSESFDLDYGRHIVTWAFPKSAYSYQGPPAEIIDIQFKPHSVLNDFAASIKSKTAPISIQPKSNGLESPTEDTIIWHAPSPFRDVDPIIEYSTDGRNWIQLPIENVLEVTRDSIDGTTTIVLERPNGARSNVLYRISSVVLK